MGEAGQWQESYQNVADAPTSVSLTVSYKRSTNCDLFITVCCGQFAADLNPSGVFSICFTAHSGRCEVQGKAFERLLLLIGVKCCKVQMMIGLGLLQPDYRQLLLVQVRLFLAS